MHSFASTRSMSCSSLVEDSTHRQNKPMVPTPSHSAIRFWSPVPLTPLFLHILEIMMCTFLDISDNMKYNKTTNLPSTISGANQMKSPLLSSYLVFCSYLTAMTWILQSFSPFVMKSRSLVITKINI